MHVNLQDLPTLQLLRGKGKLLEDLKKCGSRGRGDYLATDMDREARHCCACSQSSGAGGGGQKRGHHFYGITEATSRPGWPRQIEGSCRGRNRPPRHR